MPLIPAGLSNLNSKVESARKGFNSTLDKAGQKTGVFKGPDNPKTASKPLPPPAYTGQPNRLKLPPPPPPPARKPLIQNQYDEESYEPAQPPPPPPPPVARKPMNVSSSSTPYRPPPTSLNGYGPPNMAPVQPTSRYGPPSPPKSSAQLHEESRAMIEAENSTQPPPMISSKKPDNWGTTPPVRSFQRKHGQIPFPPFSQFTEEDKQAFFMMLDEFFGRRFPDRQASHDTGPPQVTLRTRPSILTQQEEEEGCRAEIIARYFKTYRSWTRSDQQWYRHQDPVPTPLIGTTDIKRVSCWTQTGDKRTQINYILFPDLSQLWTSVNFLVSSNGIPQEALAKYRPPPRTHEYDYETLVTKSSEIYGPYIVEFAIEAEESGRHIARGECWDLANEALKSSPIDPPPLTSISRTHGILLYYGTSTGLHKGFGEWKQNGDLAGIRPGDIIEWNRVSCKTVNPDLLFTLGDPDHTAIIIDAHGNTITETDTPPYKLGYITVIEQSLKQIPVRRTYDLSTIQAGQVWLYRPMAEETLLGNGRNSAVFPPPFPAF
ncbi:hypothetical protein PSHT_06903 [Puccinia striiformis]|uniref:BBC1/AIM3 cysteine proteinase-fold domain-containing protein n=1 Tax=Puccinia striiformis TaxID=27350 RepID=A0A2S4W2E4_9BASI|nr:hypothetical protein PSHT_06903 [Puccinia striiformis]